MKFVSWNVNGIRACVQKGFLDFFNGDFVSSHGVVLPGGVSFTGHTSFLVG